MALHAAHAATLDGLFHFLAEGGSIAAFESVFPALHSLASTAGPRVASSSALYPRDHACCLADSVASLYLVEISHRLSSTLRLWKTGTQMLVWLRIISYQVCCPQDDIEQTNLRHRVPQCSHFHSDNRHLLCLRSGSDHVCRTGVGRGWTALPVGYTGHHGNPQHTRSGTTEGPVGCTFHGRT